MVKRAREILEREVEYGGSAISVRVLEESIAEERARQNRQIAHLGELRAKNEEMQGALAEEMRRLRDLGEGVGRSSEGRGLAPLLERTLARMPWFRGRPAQRRSIEELLRHQYEESALRLREAAELADRLLASKADLQDEIARLNEKIVEAARNEALAQGYVDELREVIAAEEVAVERLPRGAPERRELEAELDAAKRKAGEHAAKLSLYSTAEERYERLKESTRQLADTIGQLQSDITVYVTAAGEKLDLIAGQIQAIGAAADASVVMLELQSSLEAMTESVNQATRFVSETQAYFRENVDRMVGALELYDRETEDVLTRNLAAAQIERDLEE